MPAEPVGFGVKNSVVSLPHHSSWSFEMFSSERCDDSSTEDGYSLTVTGLVTLSHFKMWEKKENWSETRLTRVGENFPGFSILF